MLLPLFDLAMREWGAELPFSNTPAGPSPLLAPHHNPHTQTRRLFNPAKSNHPAQDAPCPGARLLVDIKPVRPWLESVWTTKTTKEDESRERQPAHHREGPLSRLSPAEYSRPFSWPSWSKAFVTFVVLSTPPRSSADAPAGPE